MSTKYLGLKSGLKAYGLAILCVVFPPFILVMLVWTLINFIRSR